MVKTYISCELNLDPDPKPVSCQIFSGDWDLVRFTSNASYVSQGTHTMLCLVKGSKSGCQSTYPIRHIKKKCLGLSPLKDCYYTISYMSMSLWVYSRCVCVGTESEVKMYLIKPFLKCKRNTSQGQPKIQWGMWATHINSWKNPRHRKKKEKRKKVIELKKRMRMGKRMGF